MMLTHDTHPIADQATFTDPTYWFERTDAETERLITQGRLFNPLTRWILLQAGLAPGMKVLDLGTGPGEVALVAADLVGPDGAVVGVDTDPAAIELARSRARRAGINHVSFVAGDCRTTDLGHGFDAVVGRFILMYVNDPATTLASQVERLVPGGIVAFQETNIAHPTVQTWPPLPTWERVMKWVSAAGEQAGLDMHAGYHLRQTFLDAGLPAPQMQLDSAVGGGPDWDGYVYMSALLRNMLPLVYAAGAATPDDVDIDTLSERLRAEVLAAPGVVKLPDVVGAWTRKP